MNSHPFDLTEPLDAAELTGSSRPFEMTEAARQRFQKSIDDIKVLRKGRTLEVTVAHMSQVKFERDKSGIAGTAALATPGILGALRVFVPPGDERKTIIVADPKFSETPYIAAAEKIAFALYSKEAPYGREATPEEKKQAAALLLLAIRHLEEIAPGSDDFLPQVVKFLREEGYQLGNNVPATLNIPAEPVAPQPVPPQLDPLTIAAAELAKPCFRKIIEKHFDATDIKESSVHSYDCYVNSYTPSQAKALTVRHDRIILHTPDETDAMIKAIKISMEMFNGHIRIDSAPDFYRTQFARAVMELRDKGELIGSDGQALSNVTINGKTLEEILRPTQKPGITIRGFDPS